MRAVLFFTERHHNYRMERITFVEFFRRRDEGLWMPDGNSVEGMSRLVPDPRTRPEGKSPCKRTRNLAGVQPSIGGPGPKGSWMKPIHRLKSV
jgi:hypothetical protein